KMLPYLYRSPGLSFARSTTLAMNIVRSVVETQKPDGERLPGYHEAELASLRLRMLSPAPLYPAMDQALIAGWLDEALAALGKARFDLYGKTAYPDATFTLRLAFGTVRGYPMNGTVAPAKTTFYGLYDRAFGFDQKPPFNLPPRYVDRQKAIDLKTPLDFVS